MRKKMAGEFVTVWIPSNRKADLLDYAARLAAPLTPAPRATKAPRQIDIEDAIRATGKPRKKAHA
jgi:hypothetical protein